jgi:hypothetical protein
LGITVEHRGDRLFLSQRQYLLDILDRAGMRDCKPCNTPVEPHSKLSAEGTPVEDPTHYRSIAGALQYLTFTRPDIAFAVQQVCLFMHDPREPHFTAMKRILRYLQGSHDLGLHLSRSAPLDLTVYSDADWAGCPDTRCSTSGYAVFLGDNLISWSSKRQAKVSRSSAEAEYRAVANGVAEACWLCQLLGELRCPLREPPSFIVTTSVQFTSPPTQFSISALNIWRSTYTLFVSVLPLEKSVSCMFPPLRNMQISSPRGFRRLCLQSLGPVLMFAVLPVLTAGVC